jgi:hypothetical protein
MMADGFFFCDDLPKSTILPNRLTTCAACAMIKASSLKLHGWIDFTLATLTSKFTL